MNIELHCSIRLTTIPMRNTRIGDRAVPARKAVRYLQIESKIRAVVRYEMAANIPLVE